MTRFDLAERPGASDRRFRYEHISNGRVGWSSNPWEALCQAVGEEEAHALMARCVTRGLTSDWAYDPSGNIHLAGTLRDREFGERIGYWRRY
jgi:hypothetical protein